MIPYIPEIRFSDVDAMGHVNNAVFFSYFEQSRMHYFRHALNRPWDWNTAGIIVAHNEADYMVPVFLNDHIEISVHCSHIGTKSLTFEYLLEKVISGQRVLCAKGKSVLVCYNHQTRSTMEVPEEWKNILK